MVYLPEERRFLAAFTRFRRECLEDPDSRDGLTQCQSVLAFAGVETVQHHGVDRRLGAVKMELLTMIAAPLEDGWSTVTLIFAGDAQIQLRVGEISATLEDIGEPWTAPAIPSHELPPEGA